MKAITEALGLISTAETKFGFDVDTLCIYIYIYIYTHK